MFCAGGIKTHSCRGDSGSPLLQYDSKNRFTVTGVFLMLNFIICIIILTGIVSFGPKVCGTEMPGVFTEVQSYLPWIKSVLERDS